MKIVVLLNTTPETLHNHEAPWIDYETDDGELRVTERDRGNRITGRRLYADGRWLEVWLAEAPSDDALRHRQAAAERDRNTTPNGGAFGPAGNSGPQ